MNSTVTSSVATAIFYGAPPTMSCDDNQLINSLELFNELQTLFPECGFASVYLRLDSPHPVVANTCLGMKMSIVSSNTSISYSFFHF